MEKSINICQPTKNILDLFTHLIKGNSSGFNTSAKLYSFYNHYFFYGRLPSGSGYPHTPHMAETGFELVLLLSVLPKY